MVTPGRPPRGHHEGLPVRSRTSGRRARPELSGRSVDEVSDPSQYPGDGFDQIFSEGVFVGYRGYAGQGIEYTNLRTAAVPRANGTGTQLQATVDVRNTGTVAGTETVGNLCRRGA